MKAPPIPQELMEYLETVYPDRMPASSMPHEQFLIESGRVELVRSLRVLFNKQNKTVLEKS